jgi:geranylgeranyl pyrophosphate synthase
MAAVYRLVAETGALAETLRLAQDYARRAADALGTLPHGPAREALTRLAVYVVERTPALAGSPNRPD